MGMDMMGVASGGKEEGETNEIVSSGQNLSREERKIRRRAHLQDQAAHNS